MRDHYRGATASLRESVAARRRAGRGRSPCSPADSLDGGGAQLYPCGIVTPQDFTATSGDTHKTTQDFPAGRAFDPTTKVRTAPGPYEPDWIPFHWA